MPQPKLVLNIPHGIITATSFSIPDFARHRSPGAGKYYEGRSILVDLALEGNAPGFQYLDEGGWRDARADTVEALTAVAEEGKRTKTALSNNAFSCTPVAAWRSVYVAKTSGDVLQLDPGREIARFPDIACSQHMAPDAIAEAIGQPVPDRRAPRLYMVLSPIQMLVLSNLTPIEYVWYAVRRPGKRFRAVAFTELHDKPGMRLAATAVFEDAHTELSQHADKKTKTIVFGDCFNRVQFPAWVGYDHETPGGLYVGDQRSMQLWQFPKRISHHWEREY
ncbi:MAG: hypothetical protein FJ265_16750 [Planctomycetes bacterium]|nr:hypothetical protein [Planctomycetota bacterium]